MEGYKACRILLVDDEPPAVRLSQVLGHAGFDVRTLGDVEEILPVLDRGGIDLIIINLPVPGHERLQTIGRIRAKYLSAPIIAMFDAFNRTLLKAALSSGAQETLMKPFSLWDLMQTVQRALADRGDRR